MFYYSIRVVRAKNLEEAVKKVEEQRFDTKHPLCDRILSHAEMKKNFRRRITNR
jgi:hypothetical protein